MVVDTRGFGFGSAGHSHAHALQVVCSDRGGDVLIDPGTYTYVGEPEWRDRFRSTAFHNTVRINGLSQAASGGPFRWLGKPATEVQAWRVEDYRCYLRAQCAYEGFRHCRHVLWMANRELLVIVDQVFGPSGQPVKVEQFWHSGSAVLREGNAFHVGGACLLLPEGRTARVSEGGEFGWQSEIPGRKTPMPVICVERIGELPAVLSAVLCFGSEQPKQMVQRTEDDGVTIECGADLRVRFAPDSSMPAIS